MAKEATHFYFTPTFRLAPFDITGAQLIPLDSRKASEATHFYFTPTFTLTLFDVTGSQLVPLDRLNGQRGDTLLLHPNICTHSL